MIIKVCGITNSDDALAVIDAGADWIGVNLVSGPRRVDVEQASTIISSLPDSSRVAALIKIDSRGNWRDAAKGLIERGVWRFQLYGNVTPDDVVDFGAQDCEVVYVARVKDEASLELVGSFLDDCGSCRPAYVLLDAYHPTQVGGTGLCLDWEFVADAVVRRSEVDWPPIILAGGLTPKNVGVAIDVVSPAGVDVCSGVESSPGYKDLDKVVAFVRAVREASRE